MHPPGAAGWQDQLLLPQTAAPAWRRLSQGTCLFRGEPRRQEDVQEGATERPVNAASY